MNLYLIFPNADKSGILNPALAAGQAGRERGREGLKLKRTHAVSGLRARVFLALAALLAVSLGGGLVTLYYNYRTQQLFNEVISRDLAAFNAAVELEIALLNQKGFATYYFLDGNPEWLEKLQAQRRAFESGLKVVEAQPLEPGEKELLAGIEAEYLRYVIAKERVIQDYQAGQRDKGAVLHWEVRQQFLDLYDQCERFKQVFADKIQQAQERARSRAARFTALAVAALVIALLLGVALAFVLMRQFLDPIQRLARAGAPPGEAAVEGNEVQALSHRMQGLMQDVDQTRTELEKSREMLVLSEKMAVLGKLAADVAHSIRNPMTSIKMRLFSLERNLELLPSQKEDLEVVSEEMRRLDNIVSNFLEFSRPPRLKKQRVKVSEIVDMTLHLLQHRLEREAIAVAREPREDLPEINVDPELLKEVLINLIVNACEAMRGGGTLTIEEEAAEAAGEELGRAVRIRIADTGPGVPERIQEQVFEPFFSTKEGGTGLGLPMAQRIIREHHGELSLRSPIGAGATFIITLPVEEEA